jgi:hypothetical protein
VLLGDTHLARGPQDQPSHPKRARPGTTGGGPAALIPVATAIGPEGRLTAALELLGEAFGVRPPEPEDRDAVIVY